MDLPEPITRKEMYLNAIAQNGTGGGGGYTLLHGTLDLDTGSIALAVTASELYTMMQTSIVAFDYTDDGGSPQLTNVVIIQNAQRTREAGYDDVYTFVTAYQDVSDLGPDDVVVFGGGK